MAAYFIRRLLLVPITFLTITFMVYAILRVVPGGPIEQAETKLKMAAMQGEGGGGGGGRLGNASDLQLDESAMEELKQYYALDRSTPVGYLQWLGAWPRPFRTRVPVSTQEKFVAELKPLKDLHEKRQATQTQLDEWLAPREGLAFQNRIYVPLADEEREGAQGLPPDFFKRADALARKGFGQRDELLAMLAAHGYTYADDLYYKLLARTDASEDQEFFSKADELMAALRLAGEKQETIRRERGYEVIEEGVIYKVEDRFSGILQLDFGRSYTRGEPVLHIIGSKMEVSIQFGLIGYFLTWLVCVPLGVMKAVKHRTHFDSGTSFLVFLGYSMPGFVVCMLLLVSLGAHGWLPLGGYKPDNIDQLTYGQAILGRIRHMIIPITGYMVGSFATMTILMKNSLMENLGQDYVRTAFAKGLPENRVIFVHALRNSLIPITAGIGHAVGLLFAGSFLIEKTCNIDGMGLMGYEAVLQRDYPILLATLVFGVLIQLFGNILSDLIWAMIDPRIRFGGVS